MSSTAASEMDTSLVRKAIGWLGEARVVFRALRRTRPFWGGLWCILAGLWIIRAMNFSIGIALAGSWPQVAGILTGAGLVLFGLVVWVAPIYRGLMGVFAMILALLAFPMANLGGFLIGSVLGIFGASMILSWGDKPTRRGGGMRAMRRRKQNGSDT